MHKYADLIRLMRNERKPLSKLKEEQHKKLRKLIRHAYNNVPFYNKKFSSSGIHPSDIKSPDDLKKIPIITKEDFYAADPDDLIDQSISNRNRLISLNTSGSSGKVLQFFADQRYNQLRKAQFLRPYITNGNNLFDQVIWFRARPETSKAFHQKLGFLKDYQLYGGGNTDDQIKMIQKIKPAIMRGYGSVFHLIAAKAKEENISIHSPRIIFTDSELLRKESRELIEQIFKTKVIDVYGSFETENIAYECDKHEGYHMAIDCAIFEFINDGKHVQADETGEVVFTVLDNTTFPFIRFNIGDLATYSDKPCSCGRTLPLMGMVAGRKYDYAVKRDGGRISSTTLIGHLWSLGKYIQEFQIIQKEIDLFIILIIPTRLYHEQIGKEAIDNLLNNFPEAKINLQLVDKINREDSGKLKVFKSFIQR